MDTLVPYLFTFKNHSVDLIPLEYVQKESSWDYDAVLKKISILQQNTDFIEAFMQELYVLHVFDIFGLTISHRGHLNGKGTMENSNSIDRYYHIRPQIDEVQLENYPIIDGDDGASCQHCDVHICLEHPPKQSSIDGDDVMCGHCLHCDGHPLCASHNDINPSMLDGDDGGSCQHCDVHICTVHPSMFDGDDGGSCQHCDVHVCTVHGMHARVSPEPVTARVGWKFHAR